MLSCKALPPPMTLNASLYLYGTTNVYKCSTMSSYVFWLLIQLMHNYHIKYVTITKYLTDSSIKCTKRTSATTAPYWISQLKPASRRFTRFSQTGFRLDKLIDQNRKIRNQFYSVFQKKWRQNRNHNNCDKSSKTCRSPCGGAACMWSASHITGMALTVR